MNNSLSALKALVYFDLFDYPLTREEIGLFMDKRVADTDLDSAIAHLTASGLVIQHSNYYCLKNAAGQVSRRETGNELATELLQTAFRISTFL